MTNYDKVKKRILDATIVCPDSQRLEGIGSVETNLGEIKIYFQPDLGGKKVNIPLAKEQLLELVKLIAEKKAEISKKEDEEILAKL